MNNPKPDKLPRVFRGGSWIGTTATLVRAATAPRPIAPTYRHSLIGFRCALRARGPVEVGP